MASYHQIANLTNRYEELAVYRRFGYMSTKILLSRQAELLHLEEELELLEGRNLKGDPLKDFDRCWSLLRDASSDATADAYRLKLHTAREVLKDYRRFENTHTLNWTNRLTNTPR